MFEFAWPWIFILLPLPWIASWLLPAVTSQNSTALQVPFYEILQGSIAGSPQTVSTSWRWLLLFLMWLCLLTAAAGPQFLGEPQAVERAGRNIMLAVDISGSMAINDMRLKGRPTTRLNVVKHVADKFIKARQGDRLGLILFGTQAYLVTPLTFDRQAVADMLLDASVGLAGRRTAIGDAIGIAVKRLQKVPKKNRIIVLLTDGASNAGFITSDKAAEIAKQNHIKIYTIGLGGNQIYLGNVPIQTQTDLDEKSLQNIASITGGLFFRANNTSDLQRVYGEINKLETSKAQKAMYRPITEYFMWPLSAALLLSWLLILSTLWRAIIPRRARA